MPEQKNYMKIDEFLKTFFTAQDNHESRIEYFPNMVKDDPNLTSLNDILSRFSGYLGPNTARLFRQYWDARNDSSPAAQDFLNMVKNITIWYAEDYNRRGLSEAYETVKHLVVNNKIQNPEFALRLLNAIQWTVKDEQLKTEIKRLIAMNPASKPIDVYGYAVYLSRTPQSKYYRDAPYELIQMLNDKRVRVDENIGLEVAKDVPNIQNIRETGAETLVRLANVILRMMEEQGAAPNDIQTMRALVEELKQKYSMENILDTAPQNYTQKYETAASIKLAYMEQEYSRMEQEAMQSKQSAQRARQTADEQYEEIRQLRDQIAKLEHEIGIEKSKNATLRGTVKTFIMEAEARARGGIVNKGKDLSEQIAKLKLNFQAQI